MSNGSMSDVTLAGCRNLRIFGKREIKRAETSGYGRALTLTQSWSFRIELGNGTWEQAAHSLRTCATESKERFKSQRTISDNTRFIFARPLDTKATAMER